MRSKYLTVTPTRTWRGLALEAAAAALMHLCAGLVALGALVMLTALACVARLDQAFDERRSVTWVTLMVVGAVVGLISLAGLWAVLLSTLRLVGGA